jgi:hypothetical protein
MKTNLTKQYGLCSIFLDAARNPGGKLWLKFLIQRNSKLSSGFPCPVLLQSVQVTSQIRHTNCNCIVPTHVERLIFQRRIEKSEKKQIERQQKTIKCIDVGYFRLFHFSSS